MRLALQDGKQTNRLWNDTAKCRINSIMTNSSTARLEARLPTEVMAMLKRAAEIEGRSVDATIRAVVESIEAPR